MHLTRKQHTYTRSGCENKAQKLSFRRKLTATSEILGLEEQLRGAMMKVVAVLLLMAVGAWSDSIPVPQPAYIRKCRRPSTMEGQTCQASFHKWRYAENQRKCVPYTYGGCRGTDNLFDTQEKCQEECGLMNRVPPCGPPPVGIPTAPTGCQLKRRQKLENGCFEDVIHCPNRQLSGSCQPVLLGQRLPPDCHYVKVTAIDGCSRSVIDCSSGPTRTQESPTF